VRVCALLCCAAVGASIQPAAAASEGSPGCSRALPGPTISSPRRPTSRGGSHTQWQSIKLNGPQPGVPHLLVCLRLMASALTRHGMHQTPWQGRLHSVQGRPLNRKSYRSGVPCCFEMISKKPEVLWDKVWLARPQDREVTTELLLHDRCCLLGGTTGGAGRKCNHHFQSVLQPLHLSRRQVVKAGGVAAVGPVGPTRCCCCLPTSGFSRIL